MKLLGREFVMTVAKTDVEENKFIDEYGVQLREDASVAGAYLTDSLTLFDDRRNDHHRLLKPTIDRVGKIGEGGSVDRGTTAYMAHEQTELRTLFEELDTGVDDPVELVDGCELTHFYVTHNGDEFVPAPSERLGEEMLLVCEEQIDRRC